MCRTVLEACGSVLWGATGCWRCVELYLDWMVISSLLTPAELSHGTSTSGWIYSSNLYMSLMCYSLYDAVIARARSSRTEGSRQLVVVLLIVFSFSLC